MESVFVGLESLVWSCQQCVENYFQTLQGCAGETILVLRCVSYQPYRGIIKSLRALKSQ